MIVQRTRLADAGRVRRIDPELLHQMLASGRRVTVIDVRDSAEFRGPRGRIPGAISVPIHQLRARSSELAAHRTEAVVVTSGHDRRGFTGADELESLGFSEVYALEGGMDRWLELGLPVSYPTSSPSPGAHGPRS